MENEKASVTINIHGGNNQILPNATHAVQNYYGVNSCDNAYQQHASTYSECEDDDTAKEECGQDAEQEYESEEHVPLSIYINKVEKLNYYTHKLSMCGNAKEIALIVM